MSDEKPAPFVELYDALDLKEQAFVDEYLECLNATLAARRVWGNNGPRQHGYKALHRPDVAAAIAAGLKEQNERTDNNPDRIIRQLMELAYADPRDLIDDAGNFLPLRELAPEMRRALSSIEVVHEKTEAADGAVTTTTRVLKYKLAAKTPNLELLGKRLKMFSDRLELDAGDGLSALIKAAFGRPAPIPPSEQSA